MFTFTLTVTRHLVIIILKNLGASGPAITVFKHSSE